MGNVTTRKKLKGTCPVVTPELWNGVRSVTGYGSRNQSCCDSGITANDANVFLARFDILDFSESHNNIFGSLRQSTPGD